MDIFLKVAQTEGIKGTIIGEILEIMGKRDFTPIPSKIKNGEQVIGEMTDLEKAVFSLTTKTAQRHMELIAEIVGQDDQLNLMAKLSSEEKETEKIRDLKNKHNQLRELIWIIIKDRLGNSYEMIGIREGYKIIGSNENDAGKNCDCPICQLMKGVERIIEARTMNSFPSPDGKIHKA